MYVGNEELWHILNSDESDKLDFKSSSLLLSPDGENRYKIAKHIVGFANNSGGKIVFGVDDQEREPEGENLIEEKCLRTVSDIISSQCSPLISYSHQFYSKSTGDLSEGSIFVLNISQRESAAPVAIVEKCDGEIRKREYRIRSGESTRLVPDSELLHLFNESPETRAEIEIAISYMHYDDLSSVDLSLAPTFFSKIDRLYDTLSESSELKNIVDKDSRPGDWIYYEIFQRALCLKVLDCLSQYPSKNMNANVRRRIKREEINTKYNFETFTVDSLQNMAESDYILGSFPQDLSEYLIRGIDHIPNVSYNFAEEPRFFLPEGGSITLASEMDTITIAYPNEFEINIGIQFESIGTGLLTEYPQAADYSVNGDEPLMQDYGDFRNISVNLVIEYTSRYPEQTYEDYRAGYAYYEEIAEYISQSHDWDGFISELPHNRLFDIQNRIKDIQLKIDSLE